MTKIDPAYLFFITRIFSLFGVLLLTLFWILEGYESTILSIFKPEFYGLGVHLSFIQTMSILYYVLIVNLHVGGLKSVKHLLKEAAKDAILIGDIWTSKGRKRILKARERSSKMKWKHIHPVQAVIFSGLGVLLATFLFELPWTFLFNYYHFDSIFYPLYGFGYGNSEILFTRNILLFILPLFYCLYYFPKYYKLRLRHNQIIYPLVIIIVLSWSIWVAWPPNTDQSEIINHALENVEPNISSGNFSYISLDLPNVTKGFPQTTYIYYFHNATGRQIEGLFIEDNTVHTINLVTKYLTFALVGYVLTVSGPRPRARI